VSEACRVPADSVAAKLKSIVFPAVSVGNVPQLAVDLLVHTLSEPRAVPIGMLHSKSVMPCAAAAEYTESLKAASVIPPDRLTTALELFCVPSSCADTNGSDTSFALLQQRAPALQGMASVFASEMVEFFASQGVAQGVMLLSSNAAGRRDVQMQSAVRCMMTTPMASSGLGKKVVDTLKIKQAEGFGPLGWSFEQVRGVVPGEEEVGSTTQPRFFAAMRSGGFVRTMLEKCEERGLALLVLVCFVHEGDNAADAVRMAELTSQVLDLKQPAVHQESSSRISWELPPSWNTVLGPASVPELY